MSHSVEDKIGLIEEALRRYRYGEPVDGKIQVNMPGFGDLDLQLTPCQVQAVLIHQQNIHKGRLRKQLIENAAHKFSN